MRRLLPAFVLVTACVDSTAGRLSADAAILDASRPDASRDATVVDAARDSGPDASPDAGDASLDAASDSGVDASMDAGVDGGNPSYCTVASSVAITTVASAQALDPSVATSGNQLVVAWVESRVGISDLYTRLVPVSGAAGTELKVTDDVFVESWPTMVPSDTSFIIAYVRGVDADAEIATAYFDPISPSLGGANDITADVYPDAYPLLTPTATGALLHFEQDFLEPELVVEELSANGSPTSAANLVSLTRTIDGPVAVDATTSDTRLYYRIDATTLGSIALDAFGQEATPNPAATTIPMPGSLELTTHIRTTPANANPRLVLASATSGTRQTAVVQRMSSTGSTVGSALELTSTRSVVSPSVTAFGGYAVVAYRSGTTGSGEARMALVRSNGTIAADFRIVSLASIAGSLEIVRLGDGSRMVLVLDDVSESSRTLRALRLDCALP